MNILVNPGAKERLVQITGPNEENINYAKLLIEDTIKRNASPIREASQEGSCSSLASSEDQQVAATRARAAVQVGQHMPVGSKLSRSNSHHNSNFFTNDASLGEYKYTVNVGSHNLKITGDSLELVRVAKLVLDDFFTNDEFLKSSDVLPLAGDSMIPEGHQLSHQSSAFIDSGIHLDLLARSPSNALIHHLQQQMAPQDDDVFLQDNDEVSVGTLSPSADSASSANTVLNDQANVPTGLSRSRRSHFSRKDSTPEMASKVKSDSKSSEVKV